MKVCVYVLGGDSSFKALTFQQDCDGIGLACERSERLRQFTTPQLQVAGVLSPLLVPDGRLKGPIIV